MSIVKNKLFDKEKLLENYFKGFYLNLSIIRLHIDRARAKSQHSMIGQECFEQKIEECKKDVNKISVHLHSKMLEIGIKNEMRFFFFICQSSWQK